MTDIILVGCLGRMGRAVTEAAKEKSAGFNVKYGVDVSFDGRQNADYPVARDITEITPDGDEVIVDFSHHSAGKALCGYAAERHLPIILCTTGYTEDELDCIRQTSEKTAVFRSGNMSLGINVLQMLVRQAAKTLGEDFDIEIVEAHHRNKLDAPSGTALMLADAAKEGMEKDAEYVYGRHDRSIKRPKNEIGISSIRGGTIVGEHEVIFAGPKEVIRLSHTAESREVFAEGALRAAEFMKGRGPGMYSMTDVINGAL